jgi:hypothetical protein
MAIPEKDLECIRRFVDDENSIIPPDAKDQLRIELELGRGAVTIVECRPPWNPESSSEWTRQPVARLRFTRLGSVWSLYWPDRNSKFHLYDRVPPTAKIDRFLAEIKDDPTCIFWG